MEDVKRLDSLTYRKCDLLFQKSEIQVRGPECGKRKERRQCSLGFFGSLSF